MPSARSPRREACVGDTLGVVWRATLRAETAWARCGDPALRPARRSRPARGGHLASHAPGTRKRRPSGGRATGRLAR